MCRGEDEEEKENFPFTAARRGRTPRDSIKPKNIVTEFKKSRRGKREFSWLCCNLKYLKKKIKSAQYFNKHPKICVVCNRPVYSECKICDIYLNFNPKNGNHAVKI